MLRRSHILTTAALLAVCATPASAATFEDLHSSGSGDVAPPPSSIAASAADEYQDLRSPDTRDAAAASAANESQDLRSPDAVDAAAHRGLYASEPDQYVLNRGWGSPDAVDAARDLPPTQIPAHANPGPYTDAERAIVESPEVQQLVDSASTATRPIVEVRVPSSGFDWGDAGIGAAGMLALFSIAAGSALLLTGRRRRQGIEVAH
jgi:hypothetical protein